MITVSLDTAKKLKEAGWSKETIFDMSDEWEIRSTKNNYPYKAPTAQEILDELPDFSGGVLECWRSEWSEKYYCTWYIKDWYPSSPVHNWLSLAEALASLRLRCKENWYI